MRRVRVPVRVELRCSARETQLRRVAVGVEVEERDRRRVVQRSCGARGPGGFGPQEAGNTAYRNRPEAAEIARAVRKAAVARDAAPGTSRHCTKPRDAGETRVLRRTTTAQWPELACLRAGRLGSVGRPSTCFSAGRTRPPQFTIIATMSDDDAPEPILLQLPDESLLMIMELLPPAAPRTSAPHAGAADGRGRREAVGDALRAPQGEGRRVDDRARSLRPLRATMCVECRAPTPYHFVLTGERLCSACELGHPQRYALATEGQLLEARSDALRGWAPRSVARSSARCRR